MHFMVIYLLLVIPVFADRKLEFVQAIWRHGDRAPRDYPFPNDQYTEEYWPRGWGNLTNLGMKQTFEMGQFFRSRYGSIISESYKNTEIYIHSSTSNRAIESANCMLAGLYPANVGTWQWQNGNTCSRQPVPVHTYPPKETDLLTRIIHCDNADSKAKKSGKKDAADINREYGDMYPLLANWTGINNFTHNKFSKVYNTYREIQNNLTQPEWVLRRWPNHGNLTTLEIADKMRTRRTLNRFGSNQTVPYYGGYLVNDFVSHARTIERYYEQRTLRRFIGYSSHDDNIVAFQAALGVQNGLMPNYASIMIMEVYCNTGNQVTQFEVELLYRNDTTVPPYQLDIPGCSRPCFVAKLLEVYKDVMVSQTKEIFKRCDKQMDENGSDAES